MLSKTTASSTSTTKRNLNIRAGTLHLSTGPSKTGKKASSSEACNKETTYPGWKNLADLYSQPFYSYSLSHYNHI